MPHHVVQAWHDFDVAQLCEEIDRRIILRPHPGDAQGLGDGHRWWVRVGASDRLRVSVNDGGVRDTRLTIFRWIDALPECHVWLSFDDNDARADYRPHDATDFLRYVETAAAAVPGLLDGQQLFELPIYTFK